MLPETSCHTIQSPAHPMAHEPDVLSLQWLENNALSSIADAAILHHPERTAVVSSFGAESAVLLHLAARVDRNLPVLFIDTRMLFAETLAYQRELADRLGLADVRIISASNSDLRSTDPYGDLHRHDPDACCALRKAMPLDEALSGFDCWINGRKRFQTATRAAIRPAEIDRGGRLKVNPLAHWDQSDIDAYFTRFDLPRHPLTASGFTSIGCAPCTRPAQPGEDTRGGRWAGFEKTECGIHNGPARAPDRASAYSTGQLAGNQA